VRQIDVTGMRVNAEIVVSAPAEVVWDLLADIANVVTWSPECIRTAWLDDSHDFRPGNRFSGQNRLPDEFANGLRWTVTCVITEAGRPRTLAWVVLDDEDATQTVEYPSSRWRYDLDAAPGGGTLVRQCFVHGPGDSRLRWLMRRDPERSAAIIENRRRMLQANMMRTLAAMKTAAEQQPS
jgi:uncharacterized protein YndB with AHSA1/START domain